ncbi:glycosyltransferase [bacterium]|nr:glycosyltransferase [bacterium]
MKKILIMCNGDPSKRPRPYRIIQALKEKYHVTVVAGGEKFYDAIDFIPLPNINPKNIGDKIILALQHKFGNFEKILWPQPMVNLKKILVKSHFDVVVCQNLNLLPLALSVRGDGKVLFDAREYFPSHFEDLFIWRFIFQKMNQYLCETYLKNVDQMITVSEGLQTEYKRVFGIKSEIITSFPDYQTLEPSRVDDGHIKIIHHGSANPSRKIETMINMMDYVDERYSLDLMLVAPGNKKYLNKLKRMANNSSRVRVIEPVKMNDIASFTNRYDVGLYLFQPRNFNTKHMLPNKLFEFIQARLAIAIGPSIEMRKFVDHYKCGIVAPDFESKTMAKIFNQLAVKDIVEMKNKADKAARELHAGVNAKKIHGIVANLCL